jgi:hypothetical protein
MNNAPLGQVLQLKISQGFTPWIEMGGLFGGGFAGSTDGL